MTVAPSPLEFAVDTLDAIQLLHRRSRMTQLLVLLYAALDTLAPEQALHEAIRSRDLSEVPLRIGVTKAYETFDPLPTRYSNSFR